MVGNYSMMAHLGPELTNPLTHNLRPPMELTDWLPALMHPPLRS
jgi:hypothetical protein